MTAESQAAGPSEPAGLRALLAIVEVDFADRVRCFAPGCGHSVYRRIHIVREGGDTRVYGSDCFGKIFGSTEIGRSAPRYPGATGKKLTVEERELLVSNTARLIEQFEQARQAELVEAERRRKLEEETRRERLRQQAPFRSSNPHPLDPRPIGWQPARQPYSPRSAPPAPNTSRENAAAARAEAIANLVARFPGVDLSLPGFAGLVSMETRKILERKRLG